jgi:hypothetical protein
MSLTQELDDACEDIGSKIVLTSELLEDDSNNNTSMSSLTKGYTSRQTVLRAGKPGKLFLKPNFTAFTKTNSNTARAILMHDVDVTAGAENATIILAGCVDLLKLDSATQALITSNVKGAIPNIIFVEGSAI